MELVVLAYFSGVSMGILGTVLYFIIWPKGT
jgi:hypothetical protein